MQTTLMIYDGTAPADSDVPRTGGVPLAPAGFTWPMCGSCCGRPLQFFAHLHVEYGVLSVFVCQNDPGACEFWDAASGANRVYLFPREGLRPVVVPEMGVTLLPATSAIRTHVVTLDPEEDDHDELAPDPYDLARSGWKREPEERFGKQREVLGSLGGSPSYLEDDRLPSCPSCTGATEFAAHLEEGISTQTAMNLGGQLGYVFVCRACRTGAFLTD
ncbi:YwqG family protein [Streptomyces albipurpureus]|uniref:YwqG family protein n=1 Tax=Streptomyces albipurpureus TaxID=2897419 RepID=A0ABT0V3F5_9ACTN|nr:YwqG family protein [Streptomyces sp. CWNU-1]MCM2393911.1 YwqG family protein [Streptomyces sp. CWNU-1]